MSTGELLSVEPQELQFPFELKKQISCSLQLVNKSDNYVAFKDKFLLQSVVASPGATTKDITPKMVSRATVQRHEPQDNGNLSASEHTAVSRATVQRHEPQDSSPEVLLFECECGKIVCRRR